MAISKRIAWPLGSGLAGMMGLMLLYLGIVTWAEGFAHALDLFWEDRWIVLPIVIGFGVQAALYTILRKGLFIPVATAAAGGKLMGASGATSTTAMVACCLHHVTDLLPILGLTAAATFLAEYRIPFMLVGLGMTLLGIAVILVILFRERRKALSLLMPGPEAL